MLFGWVRWVTSNPPKSSLIHFDPFKYFSSQKILKNPLISFSNGSPKSKVTAFYPRPFYVTIMYFVNCLSCHFFLPLHINVEKFPKMWVLCFEDVFFFQTIPKKYEISHSNSIFVRFLIEANPFSLILTFPSQNGRKFFNDGSLKRLSPPPALGWNESKGDAMNGALLASMSVVVCTWNNIFLIPKILQNSQIQILLCAFPSNFCLLKFRKN